MSNRLSETFKTDIDVESTVEQSEKSFSGQGYSTSATTLFSNTNNAKSTGNSHKSNTAMTIQALSRLPHSVNTVTLREMFLSDAPFVNRLNRKVSFIYFVYITI